MITEAEIKSIDYASNSCTVRIPYFETLNTQENVIIPARFAIAPGVYNGYKVGDGVWVGFENGQPEWPIIIGKIFKGSTLETTGTGGIACDNLSVNSDASLPVSTKITGTLSQYNSLDNIISSLKTLQQEGQPGEVYKTIEQPIGTWIDGKTLYRRVIKYTKAIVSNTETEIGDLGCQPNEVIHISKTFVGQWQLESTAGSGFTNRSTYDAVAYAIATSGHYPMGCRVDLTTGKVYIKSIGAGYTNPNLIIIIEYTKV